MKPITKKDIDLLKKTKPYYDKRWGYFKPAIQMAKRQYPGNILEVGPYLLPLFKDSSTMEILPELNPDYLFDVTSGTWPIPDQKFDLLIALQVWEHLKGKQQQAFKEAQRVSKSIILSIPYKWECPEKPALHMITDEVIAGWTNNQEPLERKEVGTRLILRY